eukprot:13589850-Alexandrium_andersonii.AAC.1
MASSDLNGHRAQTHFFATWALTPALGGRHVRRSPGPPDPAQPVGSTRGGGAEVHSHYHPIKLY